jgi:hypothetical protein
MLLCADLLALNLSQLFQFAHIFKILSIHPFCPPQANRGYGSVLDIGILLLFPRRSPHPHHCRQFATSSVFALLRRDKSVASGVCYYLVLQKGTKGTKIGNLLRCLRLLLWISHGLAPAVKYFLLSPVG